MYKTGLIAVAVVGLMGCGKPSADDAPAAPALTQADVDRLIQQRLEETKLVKSQKEVDESKAAEAALPAHVRSLEFLAKLDELMADYTPTLPAETDDTDLLRCTTKVEQESTPELSAAAGKLQSKRKSGDKARAEAAAAFAKNKWVQYRIDYAWADRRQQGPDYACWNLIRGYFCMLEVSKCNNSRVEVRPLIPAPSKTYLYTGLLVETANGNGMPELMKRIEKAALAIPDRFSCSVAQVTKDTNWSDVNTVACAGDNPAGVTLRVARALATLHVGDLVSAPLKNMGGEPEGVLHKTSTRDGHVWTVDVDGRYMTVDNAAKCPSVDEIIEAAKPPAKK